MVESYSFFNFLNSTYFFCTKSPRYNKKKKKISYLKSYWQPYFSVILFYQCKLDRKVFFNIIIVFHKQAFLIDKKKQKRILCLFDYPSIRIVFLDVHARVEQAEGNSVHSRIGTSLTKSLSLYVPHSIIFFSITICFFS